jgi:uncharacterized protein (DUF427 family)
MGGPPRFDIEMPEPRIERTPRHVRVRAGDTLLADSHRAVLLVWYGPGRLPTYVLPEDNVRTDLLWQVGEDGMFDARLPDGTVVPGAAQRLNALGGPLNAVAGGWTFPWDGRVRWFEEATEVFVHARDPQHRVDAVASDRDVRVELGGEVLAETTRPIALFETGLPVRWYLRREDVRMDALEPSGLVTRCPYKGITQFFGVRAGGTLHADRAWSYPDPIPECPAIKGLVCFFNEHVDLVIDGERVARPFTPWSLSPDS